MNKAVGELGELCASEYLEEKQYKIISRNYHSKYGEVDIIASNQEYIVFVEVKARKYGSKISGTECVNKGKQRRIIKTALCYLQESYVDKQVRFDVIEVEFRNIEDMYVKKHIENAFSMEEGYAFF